MRKQEEEKEKKNKKKYIWKRGREEEENNSTIFLKVVEDVSMVRETKVLLYPLDGTNAHSGIIHLNSKINLKWGKKL